jgi:hypothetical protein
VGEGGNAAGRRVYVGFSGCLGVCRARHRDVKSLPRGGRSDGRKSEAGRYAATWSGVACDAAVTGNTCGLHALQSVAFVIGIMDFELVLRRVVGALEAGGIHYAVIDGFAMALRGVQRAIMDLDFILMLEDMGKADLILSDCGYERVFHSENVSHYSSGSQDWGRIDILHAFRGPTLGMLKRAESLPVLEGLAIKVVRIEDIVGLKVQASVNNPARAAQDWADIRMILGAAGEQGRLVDWALVADYLAIFHLDAKLDELKRYHGTTDHRRT